MASPMYPYKGEPSWPPQECVIYKMPQVNHWWYNNKGANQSARMHRLVCAIVVFKLRRQSFSRRGPSVLLLSLNTVSHFSYAPFFQGPHFLTKMLESNILYDYLFIDILSVW